MFFTETLPLSVALHTARQRLYTHPDFASVLAAATIAALGDSAATLRPWLPAADAVRIDCLPARPRQGTTVVALRWLTQPSATTVEIPLLDADLELHPDHDRRARLVLAGSYQAPNHTDQPAGRRLEQHQALQAAIRTVLSHCATSLSAAVE